MSQVVIKCGDHLLESWVNNMTPLLPTFTVLPYNSSAISPEEVSYVIGWCPDALWVNEFPNVKALVSIGSGVDHILHLEELRASIPVIRTVSPDLAQRMQEYVAMCVLAWHRKLLPIVAANEARAWDRFSTVTASEVTVGIMGFGAMGKAAAQGLSALGYQVVIWAATERQDVPYEYFHGADQLESFASRCNALVCLLPLTNETADILDYSLISKIKQGGCLINAARGGHLVDVDLIRAVQEGLLSFAFLDGLRQEPLPADASLWGQRNILITCHSAAYISPDVGPKIIANNILAFDAGGVAGPMYDRSRGF